jgi:hypothetical protein
MGLSITAMTSNSARSATRLSMKPVWFLDGATPRTGRRPGSEYLCSVGGPLRQCRPAVGACLNAPLGARAWCRSPHSDLVSELPSRSAGRVPVVLLAVRAFGKPPHRRYAT